MDIASRSQFGELLRQRGPLQAAAEIGVAEGRFAREILDWGFARLYLVDLWKHVEGMPAELGWKTDEEHEAVYQSCLARLAGDEDRFIVLRGWSQDVASIVQDGELDFLYIDATHYYEWVMKDLTAWYPKVRPGGIVAGHDYLGPGLTVKPAVDEFAAAIGAVVHVVPENEPASASFWFEKPLQ